MKKWEYMILQNANIEAMNKLGLDGWESVSITLPPQELPIVFFKRQLDDTESAKRILNA